MNVKITERNEAFRNISKMAPKGELPIFSSERVQEASTGIEERPSGGSTMAKQDLPWIIDRTEVA